MIMNKLIGLDISQRSQRADIDSMALSDDRRSTSFEELQLIGTSDYPSGKSASSLFGSHFCSVHSTLFY